jgi:hypothetical protein
MPVIFVEFRENPSLELTSSPIRAGKGSEEDGVSHPSLSEKRIVLSSSCLERTHFFSSQDSESGVEDKLETKISLVLVQLGGLLPINSMLNLKHLNLRLLNSLDEIGLVAQLLFDEQLGVHLD